MNEGEFSGGQTRPTPDQSMSGEATPNYSAGESAPAQNQPSAEPMMFTSADASASQSGKSLFASQNSFDRPADSIIGQAPTEDSKKTSSASRFLGGGRLRRANKNRNFENSIEEDRLANQQLTANGMQADTSASASTSTFTPNPNTPAFFNDAMASITPAPTPRKSKKPLIIGLCALAAALLIGGGIGVAMLLQKSDETPGEKLFAKTEDLESIISSGENSIRFFEESIYEYTSKGQSLYGAYVNYGEGNSFQIDDYLDQAKDFASKIATYNKKTNTTRNGVEIDSQIEKLKATSKERIAVYENFSKFYNSLKKIFAQGNSESAYTIISKDYKQKELLDFATQIDAIMEKRKQVYRTISENKCRASEDDSRICKEAYTSLNEQQTTLNNEAFSKNAWSTVLSGVKKEGTDSPIYYIGQINNALIRNEKQ